MAFLNPTPLPPPSVISLIVADHPKIVTKHYLPPTRVLWLTVRPVPFIRLDAMVGDKRMVATAVVIHF